MINGGFCQIIFTPPNEINVQDKPDVFWENYKMKNEANFVVIWKSGRICFERVQQNE
jgi:hypothetical protein